MLRLARDGPAPLLPLIPGLHDADDLHVAVVVQGFNRGSRSHYSIFQVLSRLERMGHSVSVWLHDPIGLHRREPPSVVARNIREWFAPLRAPVFKGFDQWYGADVAVASSWKSVRPLLLLDQCRVRAYLVQDYEPEYYATSVDSLWAEQTYSFGLHAIAASPWLADIVQKRYGGVTSVFDLGVDQDIYAPRPVPRRRDTVVLYAPSAAPRHSLPLGLLALQELKRRRPQVRVVLVGDARRPHTQFPFTDLGLASTTELARAYSEATVGVCLSITNDPLIQLEMLACGLPCVGLGGHRAASVFGQDGPVEFASFDPVDICDAIERMLEDEELRQRKSELGRAFVADRTWDRAAEQFEAGLRAALWGRQLEHAAPDLDSDGFPREPPRLAPGVLPPDINWSARSVPVRAEASGQITSLLLARLDADDISAVESALEGETVHIWERANPHQRALLTLAFGVWYRVPGVLAKTGLIPDEPPADIHAMARGSIAAGGDFYSADLVAEALTRAGGSLDAVDRALDFGCSSGRALRAMVAAHPGVDWHGVDPNVSAIDWARKHIGGVTFGVSSTDPPLDFPDAHFDLVYAISIWSHFNEEAGLRWLKETYRLLRPGGHLVMTVHGLQSIAYYADLGARSPRQLEQIRRALYRRGFWFAPEFGAGGDFGVKHPEWGTAFMSPEWLLRHVTPAWHVADFQVARNAWNQDVVALVRRQ